MVWAMVLSESMAEMGLSMFCLYFFSSRADAPPPSCSFIVINDIGVESNTASSTEQVNDTPNATNRYKSINPIIFFYEKLI